MKKTALLLALLLVLCSTAGAENPHYRVLLQIPSTGVLETADLIQDSERILLTSSLFSTYAFSVSGDDLPDLHLLIHHMLSRFISGEGIFLNSEKFTHSAAGPVHGLYSGDAFEEASVKQEGTASPDRFISLIADAFGIQEQGFADDRWTFGLLSSAVVHYMILDHGKYLAASCMEGADVLYTFSADLSAADSQRFIFGCSESEKNYYMDLQTSHSTEYFMLSAQLYSDPMKAGFRIAAMDAPVFSADWSFRADDSMNCSFSGRLIPQDNTLPPIFCEGMLFSNSDALLECRIGFDGYPDAELDLLIESDSKKVETDQLQIIPLDQSDAGAFSGLMTEIGLQIAPFYMNLLQIIPGEYLQKLF